MEFAAKEINSMDSSITVSLPEEQNPAEAAPASQSLARRIAALLELTKPRITFMVVLTAAAGFALASKYGLDLRRFFWTSLGIAFLSSGISALNQYMERDLDGLMKRTKMRPLPSRRIDSRPAFIFGAVLSVGGLALLAAMVSWLTAGLGLLTLCGYLFAYTPLKTRTSLSTIVGAFPGAMPPLIGWAAAQGNLSIEAWVLFTILFLWQFPHFLAIAWMYRDDYARAGIKMLPVVEPDYRSTSHQILSYTLVLIPVSVLPTLVHMAGLVYFAGALLLGGAFMYFSARTAIVRSAWQARRLLQASVLYLPALFVLMVLNP